MFIHNLNSNQQSVLIFLAKEISKADGNSDEIEKNMLDILIQQCNPEVQETRVEIKELPTIFDSVRAKHSLLLELLGIALVDNHYHLNEKSLVSSCAQALSVNRETLEQLENWVAKQFSLSKEAEKLLNQ